MVKELLNDFTGKIEFISISLDDSFETSLSADSDAPVPHNGIEPGEELAIIVSLDNGTTYQRLSEQLIDRSVRIGLHVIALPDGSSFSAVSIPEPATLLVLGLGTIILRIKRQG